MTDKNIVDKAVISAVVSTEEKNKKESDWFTFDSITFKMKRVPAFLYSTANQHLDQFH